MELIFISRVLGEGGAEWREPLSHNGVSTDLFIFTKVVLKLTFYMPNYSCQDSNST